MSHLMTRYSLLDESHQQARTFMGWDGDQLTIRYEDDLALLMESQPPDRTLQSLRQRSIHCFLL
jgi:hypothetical protein